MKKVYTGDKCDLVSDTWASFSEEQRVAEIVSTISGSQFEGFVEPTKALSSGFVYVKLIRDLSPGERGAFLLDLEAKLKEEIDIGLSIWCDPLGDRNSLRNLRGVQIKKGDEVEN